MQCCLCSGDFLQDDYYKWNDHPARQQWEVLKDLGEGAFAQVVLARHRSTGELAALKVVFLQSPAVDPDHLKIMMREAELLPVLDHPNIVSCKDVIRSPRQLVLVLEWLRGGQVIDRLHELGPQYSEQMAAELFEQIALAVDYLHSYSVLHRDIKPENVLFATPLDGYGSPGQREPPLVKLVDLGMAAYYDPKDLVSGALGSPGFVAPEIVRNGCHTPAMDMYSLGVLLFVMLVGRKPFNMKESESLQYAFMQLQDAPGFRDPRWLDLSPDAKHLLMGLLTFDPSRRLTAKQVLAHEWVVSRGGRLPRPLGQDVVHGAATVATVRRLKNLCHGVAVMSRAAQVAAAGKRRGDSASSRDEYVHKLKSIQRIDTSVRAGALLGDGSATRRPPPRPAVQSFALSMAGKSYAKLHDVGRSADPSRDPSRSLHGLFSAPATPCNSLRSRTDMSVSRSHRYRLGGLTKSNTSLMLSEMGLEDPSMRGEAHRGGLPKSMSMNAFGDGSNSMHGGSTAYGSVHGGSASGSVRGRRQRHQVNSMAVLGSSIKQFVDASLHGRRAARAAGAAQDASRHSLRGRRVTDSSTHGGQDASNSSAGSQRGAQRALQALQAQQQAQQQQAGAGRPAAAAQPGKPSPAQQPAPQQQPSAAQQQQAPQQQQQQSPQQQQQPAQQAQQALRAQPSGPTLWPLAQPSADPHAPYTPPSYPAAAALAAAARAGPAPGAAEGHVSWPHGSSGAGGPTGPYLEAAAAAAAPRGRLPHRPTPPVAVPAPRHGSQQQAQQAEQGGYSGHGAAAHHGYGHSHGEGQAHLSLHQPEQLPCVAESDREGRPDSSADGSGSGCAGEGGRRHSFSRSGSLNSHGLDRPLRVVLRHPMENPLLGAGGGSAAGGLTAMGDAESQADIRTAGSRKSGDSGTLRWEDVYGVEARRASSSSSAGAGRKVHLIKPLE